MKMKLCLLLMFLFLLPIPSLKAQKLATVSEKTAGLKKYPGYINFYWDDVNGRIFLEIDKWNNELLYTISLPAGLGSNDIGLDRGKGLNDMVVTFSRVGKKVFLNVPNFRFRAITDNQAEKRAVEQSFASATIWGFTAIAESGSAVLVDATSFLLRDAGDISALLRSMQQGNYLVDSGRSAIYLPSTKNFPQNTEIESTVTFVNYDGITGGFVRSVAADERAITLRMHHSFVQLPEKGFQTRKFDPRSSVMGIRYFDYSTPVSEPIEKILAVRHRLERKDLTVEKSEAVKPIIYYLDNGTPEPIRSALLEGASWWNQAFEAAGYINAFQVKVLPDTADPMDIRYNMINWVHRSTRGWSYGASVVDPRTGEIIKGQVLLGSLRVRQDYLIAQGLLAPFENGMLADDKMLTMALDRLKQLSAHEVGHTLGLEHNYVSSITNRASVMDYPHPLVRLTQDGKIDMSQAYDHKIGEWDKVAINWGYRAFKPETRIADELDKILDHASAAGLQHITDRDAREPGGLHPTAHLWDNGKEPVAELKEMIRVREKALQQFGERNLQPGMPMAMLEDVLVPVYFYHRYQVEAATKMIAGMNYTYALNGKTETPLLPLTRETQLKALEAILLTIQPGFLQVPGHIVKLIPPRPSGYGPTNELFRKYTGLSFDPLAPAETAANIPLSFLYHPERISRLALETGAGLNLSEMNERVLKATWRAPRVKGQLGLIQQQTEQVVLTYLLSASINENASFAARAVIIKDLADLKSYVEAQKKATTDHQLIGHYAMALERMKAPDKAKPTIHRAIPPGSPIGCEE